MKRVNVNDLRKFTEKILISAGIPENDTKIAVDVMLEANLCGVDSHGTRMLPGRIFWAEISQKWEKIITRHYKNMEIYVRGPR